MARIRHVRTSSARLSAPIDIDTDRIIPARFLKAITFDGLERHVFADDRAAAQGAHPFDAPSAAGAGILVVNNNFGCGSSREHAPQALYRWGIRAIVGESFAEIFFSNALMLGLPCLTVSPADAQAIMAAIDADRNVIVDVDIAQTGVAISGVTWPAALPAHAATLRSIESALARRREEVNRGKP